MLRLLLNIIWFIFGGLITAIGWGIIGCICYITIIGIPLGRQAFKMAKITLMPFGKTIEYGGGAPSIIANIFWAIFAGLPMACSYIAIGAGYCLTIIGIPWGIQCFKMALLSFVPFGSSVVEMA